MFLKQRCGERFLIHINEMQVLSIQHSEYCSSQTFSLWNITLPMILFCLLSKFVKEAALKYDLLYVCFKFVLNEKLLIVDFMLTHFLYQVGN